MKVSRLITFQTPPLYAPVTCKATDRHLCASAASAPYRKAFIFGVPRALSVYSCPSILPVLGDRQIAYLDPSQQSCRV